MNNHYEISILRSCSVSFSIIKDGGRPSPGREAGVLILDLPAFGSMRSQGLWFKRPSHSTVLWQPRLTSFPLGNCNNTMNSSQLVICYLCHSSNFPLILSLFFVVLGIRIWGLTHTKHHCTTSFSVLFSF